MTYGTTDEVFTGSNAPLKAVYDGGFQISYLQSIITVGNALYCNRQGYGSAIQIRLISQIERDSSELLDS